MASIYDLKPRFQALLRPLVSRLAGAGVTANQITMLAVIVSLIGGVLICLNPESRWPYGLLPVLLFVRMALNAVDGMLAREFGQKSRLGAVLNELGDVISDVALYLPLALCPQLSVWPVVLFVIGAVIVEFTGVVAIQIGDQRRYDGPMGKSDRAFWIGALGVLIAARWADPSWTPYVIWVMVALSVLTVIRRARRALRSLNSEIDESTSPDQEPQHDDTPLPHPGD